MDATEDFEPARFHDEARLPDVLFEASHPSRGAAPLHNSELRAVVTHRHVWSRVSGNDVSYESRSLDLSDVYPAVTRITMSQTKKVHVRVWERRSTSKGGQYFFIVREDEVLPIEKLGTVEQRDDLGRSAFFIDAALQPNDLVVQVNFSISGSMDVHCSPAKEMRPDEHGRYNTNGRSADSLLLKKLADNLNLPEWLRKRLANAPAM